MNVLLVNAGSSSLKISLRNIHSGEQLAAANVATEDPVAALRNILQDLQRDSAESPLNRPMISAFGHRVVHGGDLSSSVVLTDVVLAQLHEISILAPLHNPPSLAVIEAARDERSDLPHVAIFDTAFHHTMLQHAREYAIPQEWSMKLGIKRYGFHGLSHSYCAGRATEMIGHSLKEARIVICHLGAGCSASAVHSGKCLDTTMGFTPLEGLMMATRSGSIDPGAVLYLQQQYGLGAEEVLKTLNHNSGLLGVSGVSADMRKVQVAADAGYPRAKLAIDMFCYRVQQMIAALMVPLGGADALVFTAGIGQNAPRIREQICRGLEFLGFRVDASKNSSVIADCDIASSDSAVRILVIETREDLSMLSEMRTVLAEQR